MEKTKFYENKEYYCTENYYRLYPNLLITDGVKHVFDKFKAYWIGDVISSYIPNLEKDFNESLGVVKVIIKDNEADFTIDDGNNNIFISQKIEYTDLTENIEMYIQKNEIGWIACLPSEY